MQLRLHRPLMAEAGSWKPARLVSGRTHAAREALAVWAPIAALLGVRSLQRELEDLAFKIADRPAYDAEMSKFSNRHELQATTWTQRVLNRMGPLKSMNGRERMRAALARLGFEIR